MPKTSKRILRKTIKNFAINVGMKKSLIADFVYIYMNEAIRNRRLLLKQLDNFFDEEMSYGMNITYFD